MGGMGRHQGRGALLTSNLPQLQNLIKRDPEGYKEEFLQQWNQSVQTRSSVAPARQLTSSSRLTWADLDRVY